MATPHICHVDCELILEGARKVHMMHAAEPSSAAGRYQWELNRGILDRGRRAWRESGQGQSRACRVWDEMRRESTTWALGYSPLHGIRREYRDTFLEGEHIGCAACEAGEPSIHTPEIQ